MLSMPNVSAFFLKHQLNLRVGFDRVRKRADLRVVAKIDSYARALVGTGKDERIPFVSDFVGAGDDVEPCTVVSPTRERTASYTQVENRHGFLLSRFPWLFRAAIDELVAIRNTPLRTKYG